MFYKYYLINVAITCILAEASVLEIIKKPLIKMTGSTEDSMFAQGLYCYLCIGFEIGLLHGLFTSVRFGIESAIITAFLSHLTNAILTKLTR